VVAHPEVLVQLRNKLVADADSLNVLEGSTKRSVHGESVEVRRSPQAVACRKRDVRELGKPRRLLEEVR
jgi:hypothetical protein